MKDLEMGSNTKFIRMKEGKKSSLISISQEEYAVRTSASFFFSLQMLQICSASIRGLIPISQSARYFSCGKMRLLCLLISTTL